MSRNLLKKARLEGGRQRTKHQGTDVTYEVTAPKPTEIGAHGLCQLVFLQGPEKDRLKTFELARPGTYMAVDDRLPKNRDLVAQVNALRISFSDAHWRFGRHTQIPCFDRLHSDNIWDSQHYFSYLCRIEDEVDVAAARRFDESQLGGTTAPSILMAFLDLYIDGTTQAMLSIFKKFIAISRSDVMEMSTGHIDWAWSQTRELVYSHAHLMENWLRHVCDGYAYDPIDFDSDEIVISSEWRAPTFIVTGVLREARYERKRRWERADAQTTSGVLLSILEYYLCVSEIRLHTAVSDAMKELAVKPSRPPLLAGNPQCNFPPDPHNPPISAKREARKLKTQEKRCGWCQERNDLAKEHKGWNETRISKEIAKRYKDSSETIRKGMRAKKLGRLSKRPIL